jgi:hypothetical protein
VLENREGLLKIGSPYLEERGVRERFGSPDGPQVSGEWSRPVKALHVGSLPERTRIGASTRFIGGVVFEPVGAGASTRFIGSCPLLTRSLFGDRNFDLLARNTCF